MNEEGRNTQPMKQPADQNPNKKDGSDSTVPGTNSKTGTASGSNPLAAAKLLDQRIDATKDDRYVKDRARIASKNAAVSGVRRQSAMVVTKHQSKTTNNNNTNNDSSVSSLKKPPRQSMDLSPKVGAGAGTGAVAGAGGGGGAVAGAGGITKMIATGPSYNNKNMKGAIKSRDKIKATRTTPKSIHEMEGYDAAAKAKSKVSPASFMSKRSPMTTITTVSKNLQRMEEEAKAKASARERRVAGGHPFHASTTMTSRGNITNTSASTSTMKQLQEQEAKLEAVDPKRTSMTRVTAVTDIRGSTSQGEKDAAIKESVRAARASQSSNRRPGSSPSTMLNDDKYNQKMAQIGLGTELPPKTPKETVECKLDVSPLNKDMSILEHDLDQSPFQSPPNFTSAYDFNSSDKQFDEEQGTNDLVVATAVMEEEEDDEYLPKAIEYDPDAKPPVLKNRRFRLYMAVGCIAMIVVMASTIGVMSLLANGQSGGGLDSTPTSAPTCERCGLGIEEALELAVGSDKLYDTESPYNQAMEWILYEDTLQLGPTDSNLIQRYTAATFYFDTHQQGEWLACNRPKKESGEDDTCEHQLLSGVRPLEYVGVPSNRWLGETEECTWAGVACDEFNQMRHIDLQGYQIQGTFPNVLALLPYMQSFAFPWNNFNGPLPDDIGNMKHLLNIELPSNSFTGSFPAAWGRSRNLQLINVGKNFLSGSLPEEVGAISTLKGLFVDQNQLTGSLPEGLSKLSLLSFARFQSNQFIGTIPSYFGNMQLNELWLRRNQFTGEIPSELGQLSNSLGDIRLDFTNLSGPIPEEIWNLSNLWRFDASDTKLSGTISSSIGKVGELLAFDIRDASFSGQLPSEIGTLTELKSMKLQGNSFVGTMPDEVCALRALDDGLEEIWVSTNFTCPESCCTHFCIPELPEGDARCYDPVQQTAPP